MARGKLSLFWWTGLCLASFVGAAHCQNFNLSDDTFDQWRETIGAKDSEMRWAELPWLTSFYEGLHQAARENKPLLLWVMNGHPHGCT